MLHGAAFDYLKERRGGLVVLDRLRSLKPQHFCNQVSSWYMWLAKASISSIGKAYVMLGLMKTRQKRGLSFCHYLGDRLGLRRDDHPIPPLSDTILARA